jgi:SNF2 family DNA or RNA helicase
MSGNAIEDLPGYSHDPYWSPASTLKTLDIAFSNMITNQTPLANQPPEITIPLRNHQKAIIHTMRQREEASLSGMPYKNTMTYTNFGVLGDEVGSGKSLSILAYIAAMKGSSDITPQQNLLFPKSTRNFFTVYSKTYTNITNTSLIVVPHTLYRQWMEYCKKQTTLKVFYAKSAKQLAAAYKTEDISGAALLHEEITSADAVLVSNSLFADLEHFAIRRHINWRRIFVDEADTIYIPSSAPAMNAPFIWFVTATWANFVLNGLSIRPSFLNWMEHHSGEFHPQTIEWLQSELGVKTYIGDSYGRSTWLRVRSQRYMSYWYSEHGLRSMVVVLCSKEFLNESRYMPPINEQVLLCEQPVSHRAVSGLVSKEIEAMLHAGNVDGALKQLGVSTETPMNLLDAVSAERNKELDRLKKTLAFKESIDYATPQAKETALANLKAKIISIEAQLATLKERLSSMTVEECPICYDDPNLSAATLTPCCHRIFCAPCILTSLTRQMTCPLCRMDVNPKQLVQLVKEKKKKPAVAKKYLTKPRQLLKFLKENPTARVLVFGRYENPFHTLETDCELENITYHTLRGNKDTIATTIRSFEAGEKRVLFLPTETVGAGLNLVSATHIVLLHAMTPEEEKQAIGRAYRLGRTEPLNVVRLLHEGETCFVQV